MKKPPIYSLHELNIEKYSNDLTGISHLEDGKVVFVNYAMPGETVQAKVFKVKKDFVECDAIEVISPSPSRVAPRCGHFMKCGGCRAQHIDADGQSSIKAGLFRETLETQFGISTNFMPVIAAESPWNYRNKMDYTIFPAEQDVAFNHGDESADPDAVCIGFFRRNSFSRLININECHIGHPRALEIISAIKDFLNEKQITAYHTKNSVGIARNLMIRSTLSGEIMVNLVVNEKIDTDGLAECLSPFDLTSLYVTNNVSLSSAYKPESQELIYGKPFIKEEVCGMKFKIGPNTFFQTNSVMAEKLFSRIKELADLKETDTLLDAYCGTGTIGISIAKGLREVIGIDEIKDSINAAYDNADDNGLDNARFIIGKVEDALSSFEGTSDKFDAIIFDPPRAGLHPKTIKHISENRVKKIIYVSCNPATLGRDLSLLVEAGYTVVSTQPVDMFPHTPHLESITVLTS